MAVIAEWMKQAIDVREDEARLAQLKAEVQEFVQEFPLPSDR
jgi:glycine/serine hydroxymethyltransferase